MVTQEDPDNTINQAAHILYAKKMSKKKAPLPPKRTSSFRDIGFPPPPKDAGYYPDTLVEIETQTDSLMTDSLYEDGEGGICSVIESVDREFRFLNEGNMSESFLSDQHKSQSSSEELLSTTGSQSRSGSLERILEHRIMSAANRSRSSSRDRSLSGSSPLKSSGDQKTPDTDMSDIELPPPPPSLLSGLPEPEPPPPQISRSFAPPANAATQSLPLDHLRNSLRKTRPKPVPASSDSPNTTVSNLEVDNVEQASSRYGTIPKGARIGAFLASLEQNGQGGSEGSGDASESRGVSGVGSFPPGRSHSHSSPTKRTLMGMRSLNSSSTSSLPRMPTPDIKRKVEDWKVGRDNPSQQQRQASLDQSQDVLAAVVPPSRRERETQSSDSELEKVSGPEHNVKPSTIIRSSSSHAVSVEAAGESDISNVSSFLQRQKSDLTDSKYSSLSKLQSASPVMQERHSIPEKMSPLTEWKKPKPVPSPRSQPRFQTAKVTSDTGDFVELLKEVASKKRTVGSPSPAISGFQSSTSSEELLDSKSVESPGSPDLERGSRHNSLSKKLSPPVPKKPVAPQPARRSNTMPSKRELRVKEENNVASSLDSSTDSLVDTLSLASKPSKQPDFFSLHLSSKKDIKDTSKSKKSSKKQKSQEAKHTSPVKDKKSLSTKIYATTSSSQQTDSGPKPGLVGARHVLPGSMPVLPNQASASVLPQQIPSRTQLHHIEKAAPITDNDESIPVTKDELISLSHNLTNSLQALNCTSNKHSSKFMHLSEEVQTFYKSCFSYVESLPPHGKFQFRELLNTLQSIAESLKTCSGSNVREYDRIMTDLENSIKDINNVLKR